MGGARNDNARYCKEKEGEGSQNYQKINNITNVQNQRNMKALKQSSLYLVKDI